MTKAEIKNVEKAISLLEKSEMEFFRYSSNHTDYDEEQDDECGSIGIDFSELISRLNSHLSNYKGK